MQSLGKRAMKALIGATLESINEVEDDSVEIKFTNGRVLTITGDLAAEVGSPVVLYCGVSDSEKVYNKPSAQALLGYCIGYQSPLNT